MTHGNLGKSPGIMWISGNCVMCVTAQAGTVKQLLKLYGNKFPSDLPKKLDIDMVKWHKDEVEMAFPRMKANIPGEKPVRIGWFGWNLRIIREAVVLPKRFPQTLKDSPKVPSEQYKQDLYDKLLQWWQQNNAKLEWSPKPGKLVVTEKKEEKRKKFLGIF